MTGNKKGSFLKPLEQPPLDGVLVVMQQTVELILQELSVTIHQSELQERISTLQKKMNHGISQIEECDETLQDIENLENKNEFDGGEVNRQHCDQPTKIMLIEVDTKSQEDHDDDSSYEFHEFLSEVVRMHKVAKILDIGVVGDSAHDWQTVLAIWKKVIDDCKSTWTFIIGQIGLSMDMLPTGEDNELHRNSRFFHFQLYLTLLLVQLLCLKSCVKLTVRSCESCKLTSKALFQPLSDGKLIGESIAMVVTLIASIKIFFEIDVSKVTRLSNSELDQLIRSGHYEDATQWFKSSNYISLKLPMNPLVNTDIVPPNLLPKDLLKKEDTDMVPLFSRPYRFHAETNKTETQCIDIPKWVGGFIECHAEETIEGLSKISYELFHQYHSRNSRTSKSKSSHNSDDVTMNSWVEQIIAYCHVGLGRYWDAVGSDVHSDFLFTNSVAYTLYHLRLHQRVEKGKLASIPLVLHHSSLISIASMSTRLIDRYDHKSHNIGLYLLFITLREFTMASATVDFVEWSLPKLQQTLEVVTSPLAQIICFRLIQTMLSCSDQSVVLQRNSHILLSTTSDDINRDFVPYRVWAKLIPLHISLLVIPEVIIGCQLSEIVDALLHCINLWHLPTQAIVVLIISNLMQRLHGEIELYSDRIFTELFRMKIFYTRKLLPDVSGADEYETEEHLKNIEKICMAIAKSYPTVYRRWLDLTTSPVALGDYMKYLQSKEPDIKERIKQQANSESAFNNNESSLEYVSDLIDEFNHSLLFGQLS